MYKNFEVVAFICCRGGSKGIPGKNIKEFCGKPLLGWILDAAKSANVFDSIILSTDSEEIATVGERYGATIPELRPSHLAQDDSDQFDTHAYLFDLLKISDDTHRVCNLNNNPFIDNNLIIQGYQKATSIDYKRIVLDTVRVESDYVFFRQCFEYEDHYRYKFPLPMLESQINRQTIVPLYTSINNMRWSKPSVLRSFESYKKEIFTNGFSGIPLSKQNNFDLDDVEDWFIAEAIFEALRKKSAL
jgi:CMP-N-acetylneuraminic acid synthetase